MTNEIIGAVTRLAKREEPRGDALATVGAVYADGITLIFDGATAPTTKRYKYNKSATFAVGDRVKIARVGGTYIVEYPI